MVKNVSMVDVADKKALFTIDLEAWYHAVIPEKEWPKYEDCLEEPVDYLLELFDRYQIKAHWFALGIVARRHPELIYEISRRGHKIGSHSYWHEHNCEKGSFSDKMARTEIELYLVNGECHGFRSPYWDTTPMPWPPSGGFLFRLMPYWYVKWAVQTSGIFWLHPHDLMENHPKLSNPWFNWKRHINLKEAKVKLERLIKDVEWQTS